MTGAETKIRPPPIVLLGLILAGVGFCYWEVLGNGYVWDDRLLILDEPGFTSWERLGQLLSNTGGLVPENYYRPLTAIQIFFQLQLGNRDPALLHAVSLLVHLANTALVFLLARLFSARFGALSRYGAADRIVPWLAAALYGIHPALIESVSWAAAQADLMVTFYLLACLALSIDRVTPLRFAAIALLFLCAGLSKESAIVLPLALMAIDAFDMRRRQQRFLACLAERYPIYLAMFLGGVGVLLVRYLGTGHLWVSADESQPTGTLIQHGLFVGQALFAYLHAGFFPFDSINPYHPVSLPVDAAHALPWIQSLAALAVLGTSVLGMRKGLPWALMGTLYVVALLPVLQIIPLPTSADLYHDRYMTFPLAFLALGASIPIGRGVAGPRINAARTWMVRAAVVGWIAAAAASVLATVPLWRSDVTLWSWVAQRNPDTISAAANLANAYVAAGRREDASALNRVLLDRFPGHYEPLINLGVQAVAENRFEEGIGYLERAIQAPRGIPKKAYALALVNLGFAETAGGDLDRAEVLLSEAVKVSPRLVSAMSNLSLVQRLKGDAARADATWARAVALVPEGDRAEFAAHANSNLNAFRRRLQRTAPSAESRDVAHPR